MTNVIVRNNLVQTPAAAAPTWPDPESVDARAVICYDNAATRYDCIVSADSEAVGYEADNALDGLTYSYWKPSSGGDHYLTMTLSGGAKANFVGLAAHDLFTRAASIDFQYSDDGVTWTSALSGGYAPASDSPLVLFFNDLDKRYYRLKVSAAEPARIGALMFGQRLALQRSIHVEHAPAPYNRDVRFTSNESEGGNFLGRSVVRRANAASFQLRRITQDWGREYWEPFALASETQPFFFAWNIVDRPTEVIYGFSVGERPRLVNDRGPFMSTSLTIRGLA